MTTGHAQDAEQPETGITPGDKGAFRDVLSKDHARRGKPPVHLVDMTPDERIAKAKDLGLPKFRVKQLANHYFGRLETKSEAFTDLPAATRGDIVEAFFPPLIDEVTHQVADQGTTIKTLWRLSMALTSNPYSCVTRTAPRYASPARSAAAWAVRSARPASLDSPATCRPARSWNRCASPLV